MEVLTSQPKKKQNKKKKNAQKTFKPIDPNYCEFKKAEKKFRLYKDYITDFSELLSFSENCDISSLPIEKKVISGFTVYKFLDPQGSYLVKNFMEIPEQIHLTMKCLNEYHAKPYRTNLFIYENEGNSINNFENSKSKDQMPYGEEEKLENSKSKDQMPHEEEKLQTDEQNKEIDNEKSCVESFLSTAYNKERYLINYLPYLYLSTQ